MLVLHYDPATGELLGASEAQESPLEPGVYLIPAHATDQAPPEAGPDQIVRFVGGTWVVEARPSPPPPPPEPTPEELDAAAWARLRAERDRRRAASDWTQLPDVPMDPALRAAWTEYRQALRDLPANTVDPFNPKWPVPPA